jgi:hypothetical protein
MASSLKKTSRVILKKKTASVILKEKNDECNGKKKRRVFTVMALLGHRTLYTILKSNVLVATLKFLYI